MKWALWWDKVLKAQIASIHLFCRWSKESKSGSFPPVSLCHSDCISHCTRFFQRSACLHFCVTFARGAQCVAMNRAVGTKAKHQLTNCGERSSAGSVKINSDQGGGLPLRNLSFQRVCRFASNGSSLDYDVQLLPLTRISIILQLRTKILYQSAQHQLILVKVWSNSQTIASTWVRSMMCIGQRQVCLYIWIIVGELPMSVVFEAF